MLRTSIYRRALVGARANRRAFHVSSIRSAASVFTMPAMSPTMEEGGVVEWKFKPGESFAVGDVLLEVETDKATIDVEAQDDGVMVKILAENGEKGIPVGKPIAVLGEPGDDFNTVELPDLNETKAPEAKKEAAPAPEPKKEPVSAPIEQKATVSDSSLSAKANPSQKLLPSVELLLENSSISHQDALDKIPATGPNGRLLKGDVLAYLGDIPKDSTVKIAEFIQSRSHLDLSNIVLAEKKVEEPKKEVAIKAKPEPLVIKKTFDLSNLLELTEEVRAFDLDSFVEEASRKAEAYAYSSASAPKSDFYDEIFETLLVERSSVSRFSVDLKVKNSHGSVSVSGGANEDIFDILTGLKQLDSYSGESAAVPEVEVSVEVNEKLVDSKQKVTAYLQKLGEYLEPEL